MNNEALNKAKALLNNPNPQFPDIWALSDLEKEILNSLATERFNKTQQEMFEAKAIFHAELEKDPSDLPISERILNETQRALQLKVMELIHKTQDHNHIVMMLKYA